MAFVSDSFTDTDGTLLTAHTGETGATWTALIGTSPDIASNSAHPNSSGEAVAYASGVPASAEYDVEGVFVGSPSASYGIGMTGRIDTGVSTGTYYLQWNSTTAYILYKAIAGSFTNIGSYTSTPTSGDTLKLEIRNAAKKIFLNGTERISSANNDITGAGRVGFRSYGNSTAVGIDTLSATDVGGGGTIVDLSSAAYSWTKNTQQLLLNSNFSASTLNFSAQSTQNTQVINTTTGTLTETPQPIQNRLDLFLTTATQTFTPATIAISLSIGLGSAFLYFLGQGVEVSGAVAVTLRLLALMGVGS